uniref:NADH-ubiquinone oxidoreductase subunit B14.7 n=1 Tax=Panagrolaimus superbus TaxID=310955 RepID=A0A914Z7N3_9BILA
MGHDEDGPLRPTYNHQRPPWIGLHSDRKYTKQPEWWAEPGLKDPILRRGGFYGNKPSFREDDPRYYDAPVPDGTSLSGAMGVDARYNSNLAIKGDQPGNLWEWQQKVMKGSLQYKKIVEKYDISPEHPGIAVNPNMSDMWLSPVRNIGIGTLTSTSWQKYGPRFFDKPLNEGCVEKALCAAKYVAIFMAPFTMAEIRAKQSIPVKEFTARKFLARYLKLSPFPIAVASTWAVSICTAATIRNKDDVRNHLYAGPITGAFVASIKNNIPVGIIVAFFATTLGVVWQYQRLSEHGLQGKILPQQVSGWHGGPLHWKYLMQGDVEVPKHVY